MNTLKFILQIIFLFPITLIGLCYVGLFTLLKWYSYKGKFGPSLVWVVNDNIPKWLYNIWIPWGGHTIGNIIILKQKNINLTILKHELEHVRQQMILGFLFPFVYAFISIAIKLVCKKSDWYLSNSFEIESRRVAGQIVDMEGFLKRIQKQNKSK